MGYMGKLGVEYEYEYETMGGMEVDIATCGHAKMMD